MKIISEYQKLFKILETFDIKDNYYQETEAKGRRQKLEKHTIILRIK